MQHQIASLVSLLVSRKAKPKHIWRLFGLFVTVQNTVQPPSRGHNITSIHRVGREKKPAEKWCRTERRFPFLMLHRNPLFHRNERGEEGSSKMGWCISDSKQSPPHPQQQHLPREPRVVISLIFACIFCLTREGERESSWWGFSFATHHPVKNM